MERNQSLVAAEEACAWAAAPCRIDPDLTNYERLYLDVLHAVRSTDPGVPIVTNLPGLAMARWPCLSRMLVMDRPELIERIHPQYVDVLDSQAGIAWLQLQFAAVTGHRPTARSWRHAMGVAGL